MIRRSLSVVALVVGTAFAGQSVSAQSAATQAQAPESWPPPGVVKMKDAGVQAPSLVKDRKPGYTAAAMKAGIQGAVEVEAIVQADGRVGDVRVIRSLDTIHGLDQQAVDAVKQWEFKPGRKDGKAVAVLVNIELTFALRR